MKTRLGWLAVVIFGGGQFHFLMFYKRSGSDV